MLSNRTIFNKSFFQRSLIITIATILCISIVFSGCGLFEKKRINFTKTNTFSGVNRDFGEPFGVAVDKQNNVYVSDGDAGKIFKVLPDGKPEMVTDKLNTPSAIAFDDKGNLVVADSGSNTIKTVNVANGEIKTIAGAENKSGFADGEAAKALFNAPIGLAISKEGKIYVADTYNDRIRVIADGRVSTLAGSSRGFSDESGEKAKFDTPCGVAILQDRSLLIADTGNRRLRQVLLDGTTITVAGTGEQDSFDGFPLQAKFVEPTGVTVDEMGVVYVTDGNSIRAIGRRTFPFVETISASRRGFSDGSLMSSRFNRPSGMAFDSAGNLFVADAENQVVRVLTGEDLGKKVKPEEIAKMRYTAEEFRSLQPARWTYNPPQAKRDIAGTMGEIRGEIADGEDAWFHNGLDIAGGYGEKAYFIRSEKVLEPIAVEDFGGLRERLRMPTIGYIHLRLGRDKDDKPFGDNRFQFEKEEDGSEIIDFTGIKGKDGTEHIIKGALVNVRIPRGIRFAAGDVIGTLNSFNHVHLIAGRTGAEMNALDALILPSNSDSIVPKIESVSLFDKDWQPLSETKKPNERIKISGKIRIVVQAFDRMDGNPERRKLGVYKLGYQLLKEDKSPLFEPKWTISFQKMPDPESVWLIYAKGSKSGYTPETVFGYIVTNEVNSDVAREEFLDLSSKNGNYILRVFAADFFGNTASEDLNIEITKR